MKVLIEIVIVFTVVVLWVLRRRSLSRSNREVTKTTSRRVLKDEDDVPSQELSGQSSPLHGIDLARATHDISAPVQLPDALRHTSGCAVECTVFAPPKVSQASWFLTQVFLHKPEHAQTVEQHARTHDEAARRRGFQSLTEDIQLGEEIGVQLTIRGFRVEEPSLQTIVWREQTACVQFAVFVPENHRTGDVIGTVLISRNRVPIGHIRFKISVSSGTIGENELPCPLGESARRYSKAFVSYSSQDRGETLKRIQMLRLLNIDFFQDLLNLEPGQRWERRLYEEIDRCDLFLLFWSSHARSSEWVLKEVRYALDRKKDDDDAPPEIVPILLEGPPPPEPPPDLAHLHFNDKTLYFMR